MSTPVIISQLLAKKAEIEARIESLNGRLGEARTDLAHVVAVVKLFDPKATRDLPATAYHSSTKAVSRSALFARCRTALEASAEPLSTRQLAEHVIEAEGWDMEDRDLRLAVAHRIGAMLARFERRGMVRNVGEDRRATLWRLPG